VTGGGAGLPGDDGLARADRPRRAAGGEWLAVHGTGGIGLSTLILGRALGARVVVVDVVPEKLEHALAWAPRRRSMRARADVAQRIRE
jgi:D-arabinose 1-dehydrogenase-like Zn-dependent alcohol dehydrogenase